MSRAEIHQRAQLQRKFSLLPLAASGRNIFPRRLVTAVPKADGRRRRRAAPTGGNGNSPDCTRVSNFHLCDYEALSDMFLPFFVS